MGKRFNVVPICNIRSHFVSIDSGVLYGILKEICPEFDVWKTEFTGDKRETYWKNVFDFKRLKVSKQKISTGLIKTDGVSKCVHYWRLKTDCPGPSSILPSAKHEENKVADPATQKVQDDDLVFDAVKKEEKKEADPAMQKVQDNDFVVGADPGNTNIITIAAPKRAEDGTDGNLRQKDMRLLRLSGARHYRESGIMNARKKIESWNSGMKDHLGALSEVTSRGADFEAFRKFMEVRVAHWDAPWEEYTKPRWAHLRMNLCCGKQRAFANFFNQLSAANRDEGQRLVVAYGPGRWMT